MFGLPPDSMLECNWRLLLCTHGNRGLRSGGDFPMPHAGRAGAMKYVSWAPAKSKPPSCMELTQKPLQPALLMLLSFLKPESWTSGGEEEPRVQDSLRPSFCSRFFAYVMPTRILRRSVLVSLLHRGGSGRAGTQLIKLAICAQC